MHEYCQLALDSIRTYLETGKVMSLPEDTSEELKMRKAGAFVSLHLKDAAKSLRGCIGTFLPTQGSLGEEIIHNAVSAATGDPRFNPVDIEEVEDLDISVDVLAEPEDCKVEDLDPKKYGVIVSSGMRRGLLLPDLDGVDTVEKQLEIACSKAGIAYGSEDFEVQRFEVQRHH